MHINALLTELAMHLMWHFLLEMAVVYLIFTQLRGICTSNCCRIPTRKGCEEKNATMGQQNNNQSLTPNNNVEFNLLFWSVVRDGPVQ